ncbi:MAG: M23 family metallopeptidase [Solirubrobacteraceae bacterium]
MTEAYGSINKNILLSFVDYKSYNNYFQIRFNLLRFLLLFLFAIFLFFLLCFYYLFIFPNSSVKTKELTNNNIAFAKKVDRLEKNLDLYVNQVNELRSIFNSVTNKPVLSDAKTQIQKGLIGLSPPLKGYFTERFNLNHPFLDMVSKREEKIKTIAPGCVIFAEKSINSGNTIIIQHANNLASIYKHCNDLYVKPGDLLKKYQPIASVGNTGKLSSNYHLHFELWYNGKPVNPEKYIVFK